MPFKFDQTCSCKTGNQVPGCHLTYVGSSREVSIYACQHVPTLSTSPQAGVESLGATLKHLCSLLFVGYGSTMSEHALPFIQAPTIASTSPLAEPSGEARAQQTPDSAVLCLGGSRLTETQAAYPADSKEKEKAKKKAEKEAGIERQVVKRKKIMEDHYDDWR